MSYTLWMSIRMNKLSYFILFYSILDYWHWNVSHLVDFNVYWCTWIFFMFQNWRDGKKNPTYQYAICIFEYIRNEWLKNLFDSNILCRWNTSIYLSMIWKSKRMREHTREDFFVLSRRFFHIFELTQGYKWRIPVSNNL